jgi:hypothetical protein
MGQFERGHRSGAQALIRFATLLARLTSRPDTKLILGTRSIEKMRERAHATQDSSEKPAEAGGLR